MGSFRLPSARDAINRTDPERLRQLQQLERDVRQVADEYRRKGMHEYAQELIWDWARNFRPLVGTPHFGDLTVHQWAEFRRFVSRGEARAQREAQEIRTRAAVEVADLRRQGRLTEAVQVQRQREEDAREVMRVWTSARARYLPPGVPEGFPGEVLARPLPYRPHVGGAPHPPAGAEAAPEITPAQQQRFETARDRLSAAERRLNEYVATRPASWDHRSDPTWRSLIGEHRQAQDDDDRALGDLPGVIPYPGNRRGLAARTDIPKGRIDRPAPRRDFSSLNEFTGFWAPHIRATTWTPEVSNRKTPLQQATLDLDRTAAKLGLSEAQVRATVTFLTGLAGSARHLPNIGEASAIQRGSPSEFEAQREEAAERGGFQFFRGGGVGLLGDAGRASFSRSGRTLRSVEAESEALSQIANASLGGFVPDVRSWRIDPELIRAAGREWISAERQQRGIPAGPISNGAALAKGYKRLTTTLRSPRPGKQTDWFTKLVWESRGGAQTTTGFEHQIAKQVGTPTAQSGRAGNYSQGEIPRDVEEALRRQVEPEKLAGVLARVRGYYFSLDALQRRAYNPPSHPDIEREADRRRAERDPDILESSRVRFRRRIQGLDSGSEGVGGPEWERHQLVQFGSGQRPVEVLSRRLAAHGLRWQDGKLVYDDRIVEAGKQLEGVDYLKLLKDRQADWVRTATTSVAEGIYPFGSMTRNIAYLMGRHEWVDNKPVTSGLYAVWHDSIEPETRQLQRPSWSEIMSDLRPSAVRTQKARRLAERAMAHWPADLDRRQRDYDAALGQLEPGVRNVVEWFRSNVDDERTLFDKPEVVRDFTTKLLRTLAIPGGSQDRLREVGRALFGRTPDEFQHISGSQIDALARVRQVLNIGLLGGKEPSVAQLERIGTTVGAQARGEAPPWPFGAEQWQQVRKYFDPQGGGARDFADLADVMYRLTYGGVYHKPGDETLRTVQASDDVFANGPWQFRRGGRTDVAGMPGQENFLRRWFFDREGEYRLASPEQLARMAGEVDRLVAELKANPTVYPEQISRFFSAAGQGEKAWQALANMFRETTVPEEEARWEDRVEGFRGPTPRQIPGDLARLGGEFVRGVGEFAGVPMWAQPDPALAQLGKEIRNRVREFGGVPLADLPNRRGFYGHLFDEQAVYELGLDERILRSLVDVPVGHRAAWAQRGIQADPTHAEGYRKILAVSGVGALSRDIVMSADFLRRYHPDLAVPPDVADLESQIAEQYREQAAALYPQELANIPWAQAPPGFGQTRHFVESPVGINYGLSDELNLFALNSFTDAPTMMAWMYGEPPAQERGLWQEARAKLGEWEYHPTVGFMPQYTVQAFQRFPGTMIKSFARQSVTHPTLGKRQRAFWEGLIHALRSGGQIPVDLANTWQVYHLGEEEGFPSFFTGNTQLVQGIGLNTMAGVTDLLPHLPAGNQVWTGPQIEAARQQVLAERRRQYPAVPDQELLLGYSQRRFFNSLFRREWVTETESGPDTQVHYLPVQTRRGQIYVNRDAPGHPDFLDFAGGLGRTPNRARAEARFRLSTTYGRVAQEMLDQVIARPGVAEAVGPAWQKLPVDLTHGRPQPSETRFGNLFARHVLAPDTLEAPYARFFKDAWKILSPHVNGEWSVMGLRRDDVNPEALTWQQLRDEYRANIDQWLATLWETHGQIDFGPERPPALARAAIPATAPVVAAAPPAATPTRQPASPIDLLRSGRPLRIAGIGSRELDPKQINYVQKLAGFLAKRGHTIVSGGSWGADRAFAEGVYQAGGKIEAFLPWRSFKGWTEWAEGKQLGPSIRVAGQGPSAEDIALAVQLHPLGGQLKPTAQKLHGRNAQIVSGTDLVVAYPKIDQEGNWSGGTAMGLKMAEYFGVPYLDLANPEHRAAVEAYARAVNGPARAPASFDLEAWLGSRPDLINQAVRSQRAAGSLYIGRGSIFGNPFAYKPSRHDIYPVPDRKSAVDYYHRWLTQGWYPADIDPGLRAKFDQQRSALLRNLPNVRAQIEAGKTLSYPGGTADDGGSSHGHILAGVALGQIPLGDVTGGSGRRRQFATDLSALTLTPEQAEVVAAPQDFLILDAQAGAGKTRTAIARLVHQIAEGKLAPDKSALVLVRNRAAAEAAGGFLSAMTNPETQRIQAMSWDQLMYQSVMENKDTLGSGRFITRITHDPVTNRPLRQPYDKLNILSQPGILVRRITAEMAGTLGINEHDFQKVGTWVSRFQGLGLAPEGMARLSRDAGGLPTGDGLRKYLAEEVHAKLPDREARLAEAAAKVYGAYEKATTAGTLNALGIRRFGPDEDLRGPRTDFARLHRDFLWLLKDKRVGPDIRSRYGGFVFDEMQQYGREFWEIIQNLLGKGSFATFAGDKLQRMMIDLFANLEHYPTLEYIGGEVLRRLAPPEAKDPTTGAVDLHHPAAQALVTVKRLRENLRTPKAIVEHGANAFLDSVGLSNYAQKSKQPWGEGFLVHQSATRKDLNLEIAADILDRISQGEIKSPGDAGVLVSRHQQAREFKDVFNKVAWDYYDSGKLEEPLSGWISQSSSLMDDDIRRKALVEADYEWQPEKNPRGPNQVPIMTVDAASGGGWPHIYWLTGEHDLRRYRRRKGGGSTEDPNFVGRGYTAFTRAGQDLLIGVPLAEEAFGRVQQLRWPQFLTDTVRWGKQRFAADAVREGWALSEAERQALTGGRPLTRRRDGGRVVPGDPTLVGEHGPEIFLTDAPGRIIPLDVTGASSAPRVPGSFRNGGSVSPTGGSPATPPPPPDPGRLALVDLASYGEMMGLSRIGYDRTAGIGQEMGFWVSGGRKKSPLAFEQFRFQEASGNQFRIAAADAAAAIQAGARGYVHTHPLGGQRAGFSDDDLPGIKQFLEAMQAAGKGNKGVFGVQGYDQSGQWFRRLQEYSLDKRGELRAGQQLHAAQKNGATLVKLTDDDVKDLGRAFLDSAGEIVKSFGSYLRRFSGVQQEVKAQQGVEAGEKAGMAGALTWRQFKAVYPGQADKNAWVGGEFPFAGAPEMGPIGAAGAPVNPVRRVTAGATTNGTPPPTAGPAPATGGTPPAQPNVPGTTSGAASPRDDEGNRRTWWRTDHTLGNLTWSMMDLLGATRPFQEAAQIAEQPGANYFMNRYRALHFGGGYQGTTVEGAERAFDEMTAGIVGRKEFRTVGRDDLASIGRMLTSVGHFDLGGVGQQVKLNEMGEAAANLIVQAQMAQIQPEQALRQTAILAKDFGIDVSTPTKFGQFGVLASGLTREGIAGFAQLAEGSDILDLLKYIGPAVARGPEGEQPPASEQEAIGRFVERYSPLMAKMRVGFSYGIEAGTQGRTLRTLEEAALNPNLSGQMVMLAAQQRVTLPQLRQYLDRLTPDKVNQLMVNRPEVFDYLAGREQQRTAEAQQRLQVSQIPLQIAQLSAQEAAGGAQIASLQFQRRKSAATFGAEYALAGAQGRQLGLQLRYLDAVQPLQLALGVAQLDQQRVNLGAMTALQPLQLGVARAQIGQQQAALNTMAAVQPFQLQLAQLNLAALPFQQQMQQIGWQSQQLGYRQQIDNIDLTLRQNKALYGEIGAPRSRDAYFASERSRLAAQIAGRPQDEGTIAPPGLGLVDRQFYAQQEYQRSMTHLQTGGRAATAAIYYEQMKQLDQQEEFYQEQRKLEDERRALEEKQASERKAILEKEASTFDQMVPVLKQIQEATAGLERVQVEHLPEQQAAEKGMAEAALALSRAQADLMPAQQAVEKAVAELQLSLAEVQQGFLPEMQGIEKEVLGLRKNLVDINLGFMLEEFQNQQASLLAQIDQIAANLALIPGQQKHLELEGQNLSIQAALNGKRTLAEEDKLFGVGAMGGKTPTIDDMLGFFRSVTSDQGMSEGQKDAILAQLVPDKQARQYVMALAKNPEDLEKFRQQIVASAQKTLDQQAYTENAAATGPKTMAIRANAAIRAALGLGPQGMESVAEADSWWVNRTAEVPWIADKAIWASTMLPAVMGGIGLVRVGGGITDIVRGRFGKKGGTGARFGSSMGGMLRSVTGGSGRAIPESFVEWEEVAGDLGGFVPPTAAARTGRLGRMGRLAGKAGLIGLAAAPLLASYGPGVAGGLGRGVEAAGGVPGILDMLTSPEAALSMLAIPGVGPYLAAAAGVGWLGKQAYQSNFLGFRDTADSVGNWVGQSAVPWLGGAAKDTAGWVGGAANTVAGAAGSAFDWVTKNPAALAGGPMGIVGTLAYQNNWLGVQDLSKGAAEEAKKALEAFNSFMGDFGDSINSRAHDAQQVMAAIGGFFNDLGGWVNDRAGEVNGSLAAIGGFFNDIGGWVNDRAGGVNQTLTDLGGVFNDIAGWVNDRVKAINQALADLGGVFDDIALWVNDKVKGINQAMVDFSGVFGGVGQWVNDQVAGINQAMADFAGVFGGITAWVTDKENPVGGAIAAFGGLLNEVRTWASGIDLGAIKDSFVHGFKEILKNFLKGFWQMVPFHDQIWGGFNDWVDEQFGRVLGGYVMGGQAYVVGEQGPEVFVPAASGQIRPNSTLAVTATTAAGPKVVIEQINITVQGRLTASEIAEVKTQLIETVAEAIESL